MDDKKIIFFIVEGPTDDDALGVILKRIYEAHNKDVYVEITHGDITSDDESKSTTIEAKISGLIEKYANNFYLTPKDFQEVIHLVDTDGVFSPDENIFIDDGAEKTFYKTSGIYTNDYSKIFNRNSHKRANLARLISISEIWESVKYRCYYMSCNLDHVLHDKANCSEKEKIDNALNFAKTYKENLCGFLNFICDSDFSKCNDFQESWEYIQQGTHSLERNTNLGICFADIRESLLTAQR